MLKLTAAIGLLLLTSGVAFAEEHSQATTKEAEAMVHKAITYLKQEGREKALAAFSDPKGPFTYLDVYVLVLDLKGKVLAHGKKKEYIGLNLTTRKDDAGKYHFSREMVQIGTTTGKGWLEYAIVNPVSGKEEPKVAYLERTDDLIVSCGVFKPK